MIPENCPLDPVADQCDVLVVDKIIKMKASSSYYQNLHLFLPSMMIITTMIRLTVDYNQLRLTVCPFHWTPRAGSSPPLHPLDRVHSCNTKHYDDHYDGDEYQPKHDNLKVDNVNEQ